MTYRFALGMLFSLGLWTLAMVLSPQSQAFLNISTLVLGLSVPLGLMFAKFGREAFQVMQLPSYQRNEMLSQWDRILWLSALGIVMMDGVQLLNSPFIQSWSTAAPALGVTLLVLFQAFFLRVFVIFPLKHTTFSTSWKF